MTVVVDSLKVLICRHSDRSMGTVFVDVLFCAGAILLGEQLTAAMWRGRRLQRVWSSGPSLPAGKQESVEIPLDAQRWLLLEKKIVVLPFFVASSITEFKIILFLN
jgi:hypothetical protein